MALFDDAIKEARSLGSQILDALIEGNQQRAKAAKEKPPMRTLSKLNVISEAQVHAYPFAENVITPIFQVPLGTYLSIQHWAGEHDAAQNGQARLYYGPQGVQQLSELNVLDFSSIGVYFRGPLPANVVLPPGTTIYVISTKAGRVSLFSTSYELTL